MKDVLTTILTTTLQFLLQLMIIAIVLILMTTMLYVFWNEGVRYAFALPFVKFKNCIVITVFGANICFLTRFFYNKFNL